MKRRYLQIGTVIICIEYDIDVIFDDVLSKFEISPTDKCLFISIKVKQDLFCLPDNSELVCDEYIDVYSDDDYVYRTCPYVDRIGLQKIYIVRDKVYNGEYDIYIAPTTTYFTLQSKYIPLDEILAYHGGILLHSSYVLYNGQAVLFSAPSGTGKSTQAELWAKYEGATIVNGDRCVVMKIDGKWCACGCFYKGSSSYCENVIAPIAAVITLGQGTENKSYSLNNLQKFTALYRESIVHTWNSEYIELITNTIVDCVKEIRMEHFDCVPDESAVRYIKELIFNT